MNHKADISNNFCFSLTCNVIKILYEGESEREKERGGGGRERESENKNFALLSVLSLGSQRICFLVW